jgi:hypothetical protein
VVTIGQQLRPDKLNNVEGERDPLMVESNKQECAEFHHRICYFVEIIQLLIYIGVLQDVNMIVADIVFARVREYMSKKGFVLTDVPRDTARFRRLVQTIVIMQAFFITMSTTLWYKINKPRLFELTADNIMPIQDILVSTKEIAVYVITMCAPFMLLDPIESRTVYMFYENCRVTADSMPDGEFKASNDGWYEMSTASMIATKDTAGAEVYALHLLSDELQKSIASKMQIHYQGTDIFGVFMRLWKSGRSVLLENGTSCPVFELKNKTARLRKEYVISIVQYKENPEQLAANACIHALTHGYMPASERLITGSTYIDTKTDGYIAPHLARVIDVNRPQKAHVINAQIKCDLNDYALNIHLQNSGGYYGTHTEASRMCIREKSLAMFRAINIANKKNYPTSLLNDTYLINKSLTSQANIPPMSEEEMENYHKQHKATLKKCIEYITNNDLYTEDEPVLKKKRHL